MNFGIVSWDGKHTCNIRTRTRQSMVTTWDNVQKGPPCKEQSIQPTDFRAKTTLTS